MSKDRHMSKDQALDLLDSVRSTSGAGRMEWTAPEGRRTTHNRPRTRSPLTRGMGDREALRQIKEYKEGSLRG